MNHPHGIGTTPRPPGHDLVRCAFVWQLEVEYHKGALEAYQAW